jgi:transcriptional regulator with XRE-family HTH domain
MGFIGSRLRKLREQAGYSQGQLASVLKITQSQISKWENEDAQPGNEAVIELSRVFGVTADYLLGLVDNPSDLLKENDLTDDEWRLVNAYRAGDMGRVLAILSAAALKRKS